MSLSKAVRWRWSSLACMMNWICWCALTNVNELDGMPLCIAA
jgi:hypothetical protein